MRSYCQPYIIVSLISFLSPDEFLDDQLTPDDAERFVPLLKHEEINVPGVAKQWKDNSFVEVCTAK